MASHSFKIYKIYIYPCLVTHKHPQRSSTIFQLKLSETYSPFVPFFRESELRHGRTAMLAVVGYIVADLVRIPGDMYSFAAVPRAVDAHDALLTSGPMIQLAAYISIFDIMFTAPAIGAMNAGEREAGGTCLVCDNCARW